MRFASIVGARPQFVKVALVSKLLRQHHEELLIHTGQHYDYALSPQFYNELEIPEPGSYPRRSKVAYPNSAYRSGSA